MIEQSADCILHSIHVVYALECEACLDGDPDSCAFARARMQEIALAVLCCLQRRPCNGNVFAVFGRFSAIPKLIAFVTWLPGNFAPNRVGIMILHP